MVGVKTVQKDPCMTKRGDVCRKVAIKTTLLILPAIAVNWLSDIIKYER